MSLPTFPQIVRPARPRLDPEQAGSAALCLEVSIRADARRLIHALTVPEYLEAWLSLPGQHPECSTTAARDDQDFAVEHFCDGRLSVLISGTYLVCRRRNVIFSWRVEGELCVPPTEVDIRLRGDFERTTLILRHTGFASRHDLAWHRALWNASIGRLNALYGSPERNYT